jgi:hypothetical protein
MNALVASTEESRDGGKKKRRWKEGEPRKV